MSTGINTRANTRRRAMWFSALALAAALGATLVVSDCGGRNNNATGSAGNATRSAPAGATEPTLAAQTMTAAAATTPVPAPLYGVTIDDISELPAVIESLQRLARKPTASVVAKITGAYDLAKARGKTTALTLYYNEDCWSRGSNEMFTWAQNNIPERMKQGLDYVLVSYYEEDCNDLRPDWPTVFAKLAAMFPNSRIGFGEIGTTDPARKAEYLTRYYTMKINQANYIGGYFWWYYREDMVPWTQPLWTTLNNAIQAP